MGVGGSGRGGEQGYLANELRVSGRRGFRGTCACVCMTDTKYLLRALSCMCVSRVCAGDEEG